VLGSGWLDSGVLGSGVLGPGWLPADAGDGRVLLGSVHRPSIAAIAESVNKT
jgi:hypothetical protein